eukprot:62197-Alexandrium_andersonii.AAC.1
MCIRDSSSSMTRRHFDAFGNGDRSCMIDQEVGQSCTPTRRGGVRPVGGQGLWWGGISEKRSPPALFDEC